MSAASKLSKERNKKKKDEKLVKCQQASSYGIESWFQGLPSLQRLESRGAWGGWSWALSFNSLLRFHQLSYFLTVIVRHASYYIASFLFRLIRHSPKAKGLSSVLTCLWHQTTNLFSPIYKFVITKYLFIYCFWLDRRVGQFDVEFLYWNHPTFSKPSRRLKKHFTASLKKSYHKILLEKYLLVWYHEQDNGSSGGFTNILRFENTALS